MTSAKLWAGLIYLVMTADLAQQLTAGLLILSVAVEMAGSYADCLYHWEVEYG